jgi:hypothetical protein
LPEKIKIPFLLIAGVAATAYGMLMENHYVFIIGIVMVFAGYRMIRKNLKGSINLQDKSNTSASHDED